MHNQTELYGINMWSEKAVNQTEINTSNWINTQGKRENIYDYSLLVSNDILSWAFLEGQRRGWRVGGWDSFSAIKGTIL